MKLGGTLGRMQRFVVSGFRARKRVSTSGTLVVFSVLFLAGCSQTPSKAVTGGATGAAIGAGTGAIIGSQTGDAGAGTAIGAGIGAAAGALVGNSLDQMDLENEELEERIRRNARRFRRMPPERQQELRETWERLRGLPPDAREAEIERLLSDAGY